MTIYWDQNRTTALCLCDYCGDPAGVFNTQNTGISLTMQGLLECQVNLQAMRHIECELCDACGDKLISVAKLKADDKLSETDYDWALETREGKYYFNDQSPQAQEIDEWLDDKTVELKKQLKIARIRVQDRTLSKKEILDYLLKSLDKHLECNFE